MLEWLKKLFGKGKTDSDISGKQMGDVLPPAAEGAASGTDDSRKAEKSRPTKACKECGKPVPYDPSWRHQPNFCAECRERYRKEQKKKTEKSPVLAAASPAEEISPEKKKKGNRKMIQRTCKSCARPFSFPSSIPHWPRYCRECRKNFRREQA